MKNLDQNKQKKMLSQISGLSDITGNEDFLKKESISLLTTNKLAQSSDVVAGGLISNLKNNGNNEELISSINALSTMAIEYGVKGQKIDEYTTLTND